MQLIQAHSSNYTQGRGGSAIKYIVLHYDGNKNATAKNNCDYFRNNSGCGASAHYFVDENCVIQSVKDADKAWHCGGTTYYHAECRNSNSIGIEMCARYKDGKYYIPDATVDNCRNLVRELMKKYNIDTAHIVRHYDVTHKSCPHPWVVEPKLFDAFKASLNTVHKQEDKPMSEYEKEYAKAVELGITDGTNPDNGSTRRQVAVMNLRSIKTVLKIVIKALTDALNSLEV